MLQVSRAPLLLLLYCVACEAGDSAGPPKASHRPEPAAAVLSGASAAEVPPSPTTTPPPSDPPTPARPPPVRVAPRTLATSWQAYLGKRVSIVCRPLRRIDFTRTLITADGARFIVSGAPGATPCGTTTSTFTVLGSSNAPLGGRTVLPELILEESDQEDGAR